MAEINVGQISEALNDKVDRDNRNVDNAVGADAVIAYQMPTANNNYTWYRKYKSGWVEQGGRSGAINGVDATAQITLPITMSDSNYSAYVTISRDSVGAYRDQFLAVFNRTTTNFSVYSNWAGSGNGSQNNYAQWLVCGIAA